MAFDEGQAGFRGAPGNRLGTQAADGLAWNASQDRLARLRIRIP